MRTVGNHLSRLPRSVCDTVPMLDYVGRLDVTRVTLRNYGSIASCDIQLGPLTFLVGPNGAGKSTILDVMQFVGEALDPRKGVSSALAVRGGIDSLRYRWAPEGAAVEIGIQVSFSRGSAQLHFGLVPDRDHSYRVSAERLLVKVEGHGVGEYSYSVADGRVQEVAGIGEKMLTPGRESDPQELLAPEVLPAISEWTEPVADALSMIRAVNPVPDAMRVPREETADQPLSVDAGNAATVLRALQSRNSEGFQKVEEYLRAITPSIGRIDIAGLGSWALLTFLVGSSAHGSDTIIEARSMSDGTLHALGSLIALFDTGARADHPHYVPTVGLEEPESALHPAAVGVLMDAIRDAADDRQVVVTSHSPDLLDIPVVEAEEILAVRWVEGRTVVDRLDEAGLLALRDQLFSPGQLMRSDQLQPRGGPWNWRSA